MGPPEDVVHERRGRHAWTEPYLHEHLRERITHRIRRDQRRRLRGEVEGLGEEHRDHERGDPREDQQRIVRVRLGALEARHTLGEAAVQRERDHREHDGRESFLAEHVQAEDRLGQEVLVAEAREHAADQHLRGAGAEHHEAPEDEGMHGAGDGIAEDLRLEDADRDQVAEARGQRVPADVIEAAQAQVADEALDVGAEEAERGDEDGEEQRVGSGHGGKLALAGEGHHRDGRPAPRGNARVPPHPDHPGCPRTDSSPCPPHSESPR